MLGGPRYGAHPFIFGLSDTSAVNRMKITNRQIEGAIAAMCHAGRILLEGQPHVPWKLKQDGTFVTGLDLQIEKLLESELRRIFPGCEFVGEENAQSWPRAFIPQSRIVLDPIDGTGPFARGLNYFGISLAVVDEQHQPRLAIIHLPGLRRWEVASFEGRQPARYQVAAEGDSPRVSKVETAPSVRVDWRLEDSYTYIGSDAHQRLDMTAFAGKTRALGASAAHLVLLTDGTLDPAAVILTRYKVWDVAAGLALANAAGLEIRNLANGATISPEEMFAEAPPVLMVGHQEVLRVLANRVRVRGG
jgi:fructose-1,6-bisphosphatase/inositol monophosphatase family enzyme